MAMRRSANAGDFKKALKRLEELGGLIQGNPEKIKAKLGFDGGWKEFVEGIGVPVDKTDVGRYAVSLCSSTESKGAQTFRREITAVEPNTFASCAANFVMGVGDPEEFEYYVGRYDEIDAMKAALASHIDYSLGGLWFPLSTDQDMEVYRMERILMYRAPGDDTFTLYGASVLAQV